MLKKIFFIALSIALYVAPTLADPASCKNPDQLRFAVIESPDDKRGQSRHVNVIANQIERVTGKEIIRVKADSPEITIKKFAKEQVDVGIVQTLVYLHAHKMNPVIEAFAILKLPGDREKVSQYESILITLKDSQLDTIDSLQGKTLALVGASSATGYLIPHAIFTEKVGMPLPEYFGFIMNSGRHSTSIRALYEGKVDAIFTASAGLKIISQKMDIAYSDFNILWRSPSLPLSPFVYNTNLCPELKATIRRAVLSMKDDPEVKAEFNRLGGVGEAISATDQDFDVARRVLGIQ